MSDPQPPYQQPPPQYPPQQQPPYQPQPGPSGGGTVNMDPKLEGLLCYLGLWVTGLIFLLIEKQNMEVRFHAWQSIGLFGGLTILGIILGVAEGVFGGGIGALIGIVYLLIRLAGFILWIVLMVQTYQGKKFVLPIVGPFAEQQVAAGTLA
jgi:uncharacterized membrane protein